MTTEHKAKVSTYQSFRRAGMDVRLINYSRCLAPLLLSSWFWSPVYFLSRLSPDLLPLVWVVPIEDASIRVSQVIVCLHHLSGIAR